MFNNFYASMPNAQPRYKLTKGLFIVVTCDGVSLHFDLIYSSWVCILMLLFNCRAFHWTKGQERSALCSLQGTSWLCGVIHLNIGDGSLIQSPGFTVILHKNKYLFFLSIILNADSSLHVLFQISWGGRASWCVLVWNSWQNKH